MELRKADAGAKFAFDTSLNPKELKPTQSKSSGVRHLDANGQPGIIIGATNVCKGFEGGGIVGNAGKLGILGSGGNAWTNGLYKLSGNGLMLDGNGIWHEQPSQLEANLAC